MPSPYTTGKCSPPPAPAEGSQGPGELTLDEIEELVRGLTSAAPRLTVDRDFRDRLVAWRPRLAEVEGYMAVLQHLLFSTRVTEHGVVLDHRTVFRSFGLGKHEAKRLGVTTAALVDLYRDRIDAGLRVLNHSTQKRLARTVTAHGVPDELAQTRRAVADRSGDRVYLIGGRSANRRNEQAAIFKQRMKAITDSSRVGGRSSWVPAPESARLISTYLNHHLDPAFFAHGRYGVVTRMPAVLDRYEELLSTTALSSTAKEETALRTLIGICDHPMPLYEPASHSPRLRAEHHNQMMNLQTDLRRAFYTDRDYELDLDKAHMAAFVKIAEDRGYRVPATRAALQASLAGTLDLWADIASTFGPEASDAWAARKAAKVVYAPVYGAGPNGTVRHVADRYAEVTGEDVDTATFEPFLGHPVVAEILAVSRRLMADIRRDGGMADAEGRFVRLSWFGHKKDAASKARSVLAYVAASYEQVLVAEAFREATKEMEWAAAEADRRPQFRCWLYQADGFTVRVDRKQAAAPIIKRLQKAVDKKAKEFGLITRLSLQYGTL